MRYILLKTSGHCGIMSGDFLIPEKKVGLNESSRDRSIQECLREGREGMNFKLK